MQLSNDPATRQTQLTLIKNYVETNHQVGGSGDYGQDTADAMNQTASPNYFVFKNDVAVDDIVSAIDWATDYAAFKDDMAAVSFMLKNGTYDPRSPNSRAALDQAFSGANNSKLAILGIATRLATVAEKLLASSTTGPGGGDGSAQTSSALLGDGASGDITTANLQEAENDG